MEEWVGSHWHKFITRHASRRFPQASVELKQVHKSVGLLFRALGGEKGLRIEAAHDRDYLIRRSWLQKMAGHHESPSIAWRDEESLRLPASIAVFPTKELNRELYLWLALLSSKMSQGLRHWGRDNQELVCHLLQEYPLLQKRYEKLVQAYLSLRPDPKQLPDKEAELEYAIQQALITPGSVKEFPRTNRAPDPVVLWLYPSERLSQAHQEDPEDNEANQNKKEKKQQAELAEKKKAQREEEAAEKDGMMIFRLESLFSWSEYLKLQRSPDDTEEDNLETAKDLDTITLSKQRDTKSGAIKLDLDLPSQCNDDLPLGPGIHLPEWDWRKQCLQQKYVCLQSFLPREAEPAPLPQKLRRTARKIRSQFELLQTQRCWLRGQTQGEELDLKNWVDFYSETRAGAIPEPGLYRTYRPIHRDIATLLLADLSMSTDAYLTDEASVIDVIRDSLLLCGEALNAVRDPFAMYGFSSVKRQQVRFMLLKNFQEKFNDRIRGRLLAMRPGFYTRMGAAVRQATRILNQQAQSQRLLMLLTDGKPNDIDHYEGRYGIEDTREAIREAKKSGIQAFCITIDQKADEYLPYIFGSDGFTVIQHPTHLPTRLPELYRQLTT